MIVVLAGGVGAAKMLSGLTQIVAADELVAVVNTGDDTMLHGLTICPDLDTITYTLSGASDTERGWGLAGETWHTMEALERFAAVVPSGSQAGATWFRLGDRDMATHLYRSHRLAERATLTAVTAEIVAAFGVPARLLPMTDDPAPTLVTLADGDREIGFQEYFVGLRHDVAISAVRFDNERSRPSAAVLEALERADRIVVAPSNPVVSIGPLLSFEAISAIVRRRRRDVIAVSPIVAGAALKGPADRMLAELGHEPSVVGVARMYAEIANTLVIDTADAALAGEVEASGMQVVVTETVMSDAGVARRLAEVVLST